MVARAVAAGIAIGAGAVMVASQIFSTSPVFGIIIGGGGIGFLGLVAAVDLYDWERTHGNR